MSVNSARGGTITAQANGALLKELRGDIKQREVEEKCGMLHGRLTAIERGKPSGIKLIIKLAGFYHIPPKDLLSEEGLRTTGELLADLAELRGVRVDFSPNGEKEEDRNLAVFDAGSSGDALQESSK